MPLDLERRRALSAPELQRSSTAARLLSLFGSLHGIPQLRTPGERDMNNQSLQKHDFHRGRATRIARDVACLELSIVNVYLVGPPQSGDGGWVLVDTGLPTSHGAIVHEAERRFGYRAHPSAIVLTHGHVDHAGSVRELAELWDVPVYAHRLEAPYLTGQSDYPPGDPTV